METRTLGRTGIRVSHMGMGCSNVGRSLHGYSEAESLATLAESLERGVTFYDTAPGYTGGESERLIGAAFRGRRDRVVIASKVGVRRAGVTSFLKRFKHRLAPVAKLARPFYRVFPRIYRAERRIDYSPEFVTESVEGSLRRLATDHLDLLQLHYPTVETLGAGEFAETFERLKTQGKIRAAGASVATVTEAMACLDCPLIDVVQLPLSLVDQDPIDDFLPRAAARGVGVIARTVFAQGLLLGYLTRWVANPNFTVRYAWRQGTIAMWDNRCTQHSVLNDFDGERVIQRVTVMGDEPRAACPPRYKPFAKHFSAASHRDRQLAQALRERAGASD